MNMKKKIFNRKENRLLSDLYSGFWDYRTDSLSAVLSEQEITDLEP